MTAIRFALGERARENTSPDCRPIEKVGDIISSKPCIATRGQIKRALTILGVYAPSNNLAKAIIKESGGTPAGLISVCGESDREWHTREAYRLPDSFPEFVRRKVQEASEKGLPRGYLVSAPKQ